MDIWGTSILAFPRVLLFNIRESHDEVSVHYTSGSYLLIESAWGFYQESNIIIYIYLKTQDYKINKVLLDYVNR